MAEIHNQNLHIIVVAHNTIRKPEAHTNTNSADSNDEGAGVNQQRQQSRTTDHQTITRTNPQSA